MRTSISEITQFLQCRRTWFFSSRNSMYLRTIYVSEALRYGSAAHEALELMYQEKPVYLDELQEKYNLNNKSIKMLSFQLRQYKESVLKDDLKRFEIVEVEMEYSIMLDENTELFGYIDLVCRCKETGKYYILEHKNVSRPRADRFNEFDYQIRAYELAVKEKYGAENFGGVIINQIIKSPKNFRNIRTEHSHSEKQLDHFKETLLHTTKEMRKQAKDPIVPYHPNFATITWDPYYKLNKKMHDLATNDTRVITDDDIKKAGLSKKSRA